MNRIAAILLLCLCAAPALARDNHDNDHAQWQADIAAFEAADRTAPPSRGAVLFIGSSSIRLWKTLAADFPGVNTLNRGFGGAWKSVVTGKSVSERVALGGRRILKKKKKYYK